MAIHQNYIYLFNMNCKEEFTKNTFFINYKLRKGKFSKFDYDGENLILNDSLINRFKKINIIKFKIPDTIDSLLDTNIIKENFQKSLKNDTFFQTVNNNLYVLLSEDFIYFIADKNFDTRFNFMLHLVRKNYEFSNLSFKFDEYLIKNFIDTDIDIARVPLPNNNNYHKIRIGQYNEGKNIWVQEFLPQRVKSNELLKFEDELLIFSN